ncbi:MAG: ankyrin repeat domain-containing protein [Pseudomonadota bacterium]
MTRTTKKLERAQNKLDAKLIKAASAGYTEYALALMNKGADVNTQDSNGQTPLMVSIKGNHVKLTDIFLGKDAHITFNDPNGTIALKVMGLYGKLYRDRVLIAKTAPSP